MTMLEIASYLSLLPFPVCVAVLGSLLLSISVCLRGFRIMAAPEVPKLYFRESSLNTYIIEKCKMQGRSFSPSFWLSSRHLQTMLPAILPKPDVTFERQYLQMRDKGVVALDWVVHPQAKTMKKRATVVLVIPTLTGGACHVSAVCHAAATRGMRTVVFNRRGHGGTLLTTPKLQSFGDPTDLRQVIKYIRLCWPRCPLAAVAYGTGCGLLMSYLGEFGSSALLTAGACVSPCWDTPERFLSNGPRGVYDLLLLLRLKGILYRHAPALGHVVDAGRALVSAWSLPEFDRAVYCPLYGHKDLDQFWEVNNPIRDVDDIEVPVLCVNSLDDPVAPPSGENDDTAENTSIPYDLFKCYPNFLLAITRRGGHCGFLEGFPPKHWADELCLDHIEAVVEFTQKSQHQQHHLHHQKDQQPMQQQQYLAQQQQQNNHHQSPLHQQQSNHKPVDQKLHPPHVLHRYHSTSTSHVMLSNNNIDIGSIISSITGRSDSTSSGRASLSHTHRSLSHSSNSCNSVRSRYLALAKKRSAPRFTI